MNECYDRRAVLRGLGIGGAVALSLPLMRLQAQQLDGTPPAPFSPSYGPLAPVRDRITGLELLKLPRGFQYQSFGWTGEMLDDGTPTPAAHDGMAVVQAVSDRMRTLVLIRNHEGGVGPIVGGGGAPTYDPFALPEAGLPGFAGGTTALTFARGRFTGANATLSGTLANCCGGPTPWGSWLSCEEIVIRGAALGSRDHGYVFEVPSPLLGSASAIPISDMGLMRHEAAAVDPRNGDVYQTEDNGPNSGFYRYRPVNASQTMGSLEQGGALFMLKAAGVDNADLRPVQAGDQFDVEWVRIDQPDADPEAFAPPLDGLPPIAGIGRSGPYLQGEAQGAARFSRLEGCWYQNGVIYFIDTNAGPVGKGTIWAYEPELERITVIYASPSEQAMDNPDNVTISPRGGILVCEDGGGIVDSGTRLNGTRLVGIQPNGESFIFAENIMQLTDSPPGQPQIPPDDYRGREFAGACFDPTGRYLFVNIQIPGVTLAITGPWGRGGL